MIRDWFVCLVIAGLFIMPQLGSANELTYPATRRGGQVDDFHGTEVADPYRWLEDDVRQSDEVAKWVEAQNEVTFAYLKAIPEREKIEQRITELWNFEKYGSPTKHGGRYFFLKNDGLQNQYVLYQQDTLDSEPSVLIDPNKWSADGTVALSGMSFSDSGKYLAYGIADAGSDWKNWRVMEIATGKVLADEINWIKFGSVSWTNDDEGFFYSRFPEPGEGETFQALNYNQTVYYHRLRTPQKDDVVVYRRPDFPDWMFGTDVTEDGHYLVISVFKGTDDKNRVLYRDLRQRYASATEIIDHFDDEYTFIGSDDDTFYFLTDLDAPKRRLIAIDLAHPEPEAWREIIPTGENVLRNVDYVGGRFFAQYLEDAKTQVRIFDREGNFVREVEFPGIGSGDGFSGRQDDMETFYSFSSFATPPSTYRYDVTTGESQLLRRADVEFDPADYEVKQVFFKSKDGTRIPMFIAHRKGLVLDGSNPTLMYGYGGFNIPLTPRFSISRLAWMEMGGVFAMPNLRGGGEYGEDWHQAGTKLDKQNVFDDFIAAAEWLVENDYTEPGRLAIQGGSNGGLLVGACMTQRPDLFGACLPAVGVMDMLRFHKFTSGRYWVDDYGSAEDPEEFKALLAYSPYHNLKPGTKYPATMVTTADTDDRVVPGHSFKFAAALQHAHEGETPVLIRIETRAGHGAGKPTSKLIEEIADQWAFLIKNLNEK